MLHSGANETARRVEEVEKPSSGHRDGVGRLRWPDARGPCIGQERLFMCIGKATHQPMSARKPPPASSLTLPDTLLIFLCFEPGDSVISAALGDAEGYHPANHEHLYRFSTSYPLQPFLL